MVTYSSILAWKITWTEELGGATWGSQSQTQGLCTCAIYNFYCCVKQIKIFLKIKKKIKKIYTCLLSERF